MLLNLLPKGVQQDAGDGKEEKDVGKEKEGLTPARVEEAVATAARRRKTDRSDGRGASGDFDQSI